VSSAEVRSCFCVSCREIPLLNESRDHTVGRQHLIDAPICARTWRSPQGYTLGAAVVPGTRES
jgi:hypothetical protein